MCSIRDGDLQSELLVSLRAGFSPTEHIRPQLVTPLAGLTRDVHLVTGYGRGGKCAKVDLRMCPDCEAVSPMRCDRSSAALRSSANPRIDASSLGQNISGGRLQLYEHAIEQPGSFAEGASTFRAG
jgi:hypothetical protein